jgi:glycosyltransferase involved in cell wall biosynthesis
MGKGAHGAADILHFPVHADAPTWCRTPFIVTVLDLIPLIFKDLYAPKKNNLRFQFARWLELQSIRNARAIFAISEHTATDVHTLLGVPRNKIIVTPLGVDERFFAEDGESKAVREKFSLEPKVPLILYVGGIDQRKNISFMLRTFAEVVRERISGATPIPLLVLAGGIANDGQYPLLLAEIERLDLKQYVRLTGFVSDDDLRRLYRTATVFFYPSLYEGFGLPPLEAMASSTPVVSSNTSSLPEVVGADALLFDPKDVAQATRHLLAVLNDETLAERLGEQGRERAKGFRWEETARLTAEGYRRVLKELAGVPRSEAPLNISATSETRE